MTKEEYRIIFEYNDINQTEFSKYFGHEKYWIHHFLHDDRQVTAKWITYLQKYLYEVRDFKIDLFNQTAVANYLEDILKQGFKLKVKTRNSKYLML